MKVAALQIDIAWEDPAANFASLTPRLESAAEEGVAIDRLIENRSNDFELLRAIVLVARVNSHLPHQ